ncbi:hypothetical protein JYK22_27325, partial [Nonomuraea sp. RK-328]|nr:hypothetical protein [Nonomuraea sp. RK-328]
VTEPTDAAAPHRPSTDDGTLAAGSPRMPAARRRDPFQPALSPNARRAVAGGLLLATAAAMAAALAIWNGRLPSGALGPAASPTANVLIHGEAV